MIAWPGEVLAARMFGLQDAWNQEAVFQIMDEYMLIDIKAGGPYAGGGCWGTGGIPPASDGPTYSVSGSFISNMWTAYRAKFGCIYTGLDTVTHQPQYDCSQCQYGCPAAVTDHTRDQAAACSPAVLSNPAQDKLIVRFAQSTKPSAVVIFNTQGNVIRRVMVTGNPGTIDLAGLANGVYYCRFAGAAGAAYHTFVKTR
jgi:hypothetical protein